MKCRILAPVMGGGGQVAGVASWWINGHLIQLQAVLEVIYKPEALINISVLELSVRQVSR